MKRKSNWKKYGLVVMASSLLTLQSGMAVYAEGELQTLASEAQQEEGQSTDQESDSLSENGSSESEQSLEEIPQDAGKVEEGSAGESSAAQNPVFLQEGQLTEEIKWKLEDHTLYLYGKGEMKYPYLLENDNYKWPWKEWKDRVKEIVIEDGITSIGRKAFADFTGLEKVTMPESVKLVEKDAFEKCTLLPAEFLARIEKLYPTVADEENETENSASEVTDADTEGTESVEIEDDTEAIAEDDSQLIDLNQCEITIPDISYVYNGKAQTPEIEAGYVDEEGDTILLTEGKDYRISYRNKKTGTDDVVNAGEIEVTIQGIGNYTGTVTGQYEIVPCSLSGFQVLIRN